MTPGTLDDTARRIGSARWLEVRCFEVLGGWVRSTPEPEAKLLFARQSHHHAWHAELFERVTPVANGFDARETGDPGIPWQHVLSALEHLTSTADRLAGAYSVLLPAKVAEYEQWLEAADPVRDAPLRRWLGFVVADEHADLAEGRAVLAGVPAAHRAPGRAEIEAVLSNAGPLLGGPIGG